ncbi:MAG: metallopeptidase family protein [Parvularculaceae bacterium]|jgi:predicted Zn-dependent protease with MMP-like domain|nr:metallopeptidase family protein [Parvularculaceae bacterium]
MNAWKSRTAPTIEDLSALAAEAFAALPAEFRTLCGNVAIHVAEFAEDDLLADLGIEDPFDLTGLYEGVDLTADSLTNPSGPAHVHLYRRPLLDEWAENGEITLGELVTHVLVHEIGHHFGLSDEEMHAIEERAA